MNLSTQLKELNILFCEYFKQQDWENYLFQSKKQQT
jgi:hypothetical protein